MQWGILLIVVVIKIYKKTSCAPHPWGFVVESARRYKCRSVQSAQEYMMYLDTDETFCRISDPMLFDGSCTSVTCMVASKAFFSRMRNRRL